MKFNIEIMAEILPSIRAEIARELVYSYKLNQGEVSRLLGISQPAVSQYVRNMRGKNTGLEAVREEIRQVSESLINSRITKEELENRMYEICRIFIDSKK
jgi:predicted transcriptional regulator